MTPPLDVNTIVRCNECGVTMLWREVIAGHPHRTYTRENDGRALYLAPPADPARATRAEGALLDDLAAFRALLERAVRVMDAKGYDEPTESANNLVETIRANLLARVAPTPAARPAARAAATVSDKDVRRFACVFWNALALRGATVATPGWDEIGIRAVLEIDRAAVADGARGGGGEVEGLGEENAEMRDALRAVGIFRSDEAGDDGSEWCVTLEPRGEEPVGALVDALHRTMDASHNDGERDGSTDRDTLAARLAGITYEVIQPLYLGVNYRSANNALWEIIRLADPEVAALMLSGPAAEAWELATSRYGGAVVDRARAFLVAARAGGSAGAR